MAHPRKFRFGAELKGPFPGLTWQQTVQRVEELGYSTLFVPDHFQLQYGPITAMASAAAYSDTLHVGSLVFDNDYRHPVTLAMEMATIDEISQGRLEFGIGAGWKTLDYEQSGIPLDPPKVRVERMMEAVVAIKALFGPDPVDLDGEHYQLAGVTGTVPHTPGGPPLLIAGGAKRMLRFAGEHASIVGVNPSIHSGEIDVDAARDGQADRVDQKLEWLREGAGDRFDDLEINAWTVAACSFTDDPKGLAAELAPFFGAADGAEVLSSPMSLIGNIDSLTEELNRRRDRWGYSYITISGDQARSFAPLVAALTGT